MILSIIYCLIIGFLVAAIAAWLWCELVKRREKQEFAFSIALKDLTFQVEDLPVNVKNKIILRNDIISLRKMPGANQEKIDNLEIKFKQKYPENGRV